MKFELYTSIERFLNHKGFKKYFKNTFWLFLEKILRLISGLLVGVWVARYLGPKQFGVFSYAIAFTALFGGIAKLGLDTVVVQELIKKPEKQNVLMGSAYWLKLFGSLISLILIFFVSTFSNNDAKTTMYVVILGAGTIFQSFETIDFFSNLKY